MRLAPNRKPGRENATPGGKRGVWWTPPRLAARVARWANVAGLRVVDLGAGKGALSVATLNAGADRCTSIELRRSYLNALERNVSRVGGDRWGIIGGDVFSSALDPFRVDVALLNPVFEDDMPERFLCRALVFAPRAVAIVPVNTTCGVGRASGLWGEVVQTREARLARRPSFGRGGGSDHGQRDIIVIEVARRIGPARAAGEADLVRVEYWPESWSEAA